MFKVLVVDDDKDARIFMSRLLQKRFSCKVETASDGIESLKYAKEYLPEIIFLDITMPGMSGIEVLETLKQDAELKKTPVIMLTAIAEKNIFIKAMTLGALDYILKPLVYLPAYERIKEIFSKLKYVKSKNTTIIDPEKVVKSEETILLIEPDLSFAEKFQSRMSQKYNIVHLTAGFEAIKLCKDNFYSIICIAETLPDMRTQFLAEKILDLHKDKNTSLYLITENGVTDKELESIFDIVLSREIHN